MRVCAKSRGVLRTFVGNTPLLAEVCGQLPTEDLAEVLKYPFCTGEAEQIVLDQLKAKTQRDFGGDVWKFVEQANSLGIKDVDSPAKRPSVEDAFEELTKSKSSMRLRQRQIYSSRVLRGLG